MTRPASFLTPAAFGLLALVLVPAACSDSDGRPANGETGSPCEAATECYPDVADGDLEGEAVCLDRVEAGYCTHTCTADTDCCAVEGECPVDRKQVCSPFESADDMMCLLSCEADDIAADPDAEDANDYCERNAGSAFSCRSSGGGGQNRKVCMPNGDDCGTFAGGASCE